MCKDLISSFEVVIKKERSCIDWFEEALYSAAVELHRRTTYEMATCGSIENILPILVMLICGVRRN